MRAVQPFSKLYSGLGRLILGLVLVPGFAAAAPPVVEKGEVRSGEEVTGVLETAHSENEVHRFRVPVPAAAAWGVRAVQVEGDVLLTVRSGDGEPVTVGSPIGPPIAEFFYLEGGALGRDFDLDLHAAEPETAVTYRLFLEDLTDTGEARRLAEAAMAEAGTRFAEKTAEGWRAAMEEYRRALGLWREAGEDKEEAVTLSCLGILHRRLGEFRKALEYYQAALASWRALSQEEMVASTLSGMGLCSWRLGENRLARERFIESLFRQRQLGERHGAAVAHNNLCLVSHSEGKLEAAIGCYREVLKEAVEIGDRRLQANLYNSLGGAYDDLGEPAEALVHLTEALEMRVQLGDPLGEAQTLNNLAVHHRRIGEPEEALRYYGSALEIQRRLGNRNQEARFLNNLGYAYLHLGEPDRAEVYLEQALELWRQLGNRRAEPWALINLGSAALDQGNASAALSWLTEAAAVARETEQQGREVIALMLLSRVHLDAGDTAAATPLLERAQRLHEEQGGDSPRQLGEILLHQARLSLMLGETTAARHRLEEALGLYAVIGDRALEVTSLVLLARVERAAGRLPEAVRRVEEAVAILESMRGTLTNPYLRATFLDSRREAYELLLEFQMAQDGLSTTALEWSERIRARTLLDLVGEWGSGITEEVPEALLEQRRALRRRLNAKADRQETLSQRGADERELEAVEQERYAVMTRLDTLEAEIRKASPRYASLVSADPIPVEEIRGLLDADTWLLEYALGERESYLWLVTGEGIETFLLPPREQIEEAARAAYEALSRLDLRAGRRRRMTLEGLSRMVLGPVRSRLEDQRLVVVADGALHYVPFAALPGSGGAPLLVQHEVVSLPSASVLAAQRRRDRDRPMAAGVLAVLADPVFSSQDPRVGEASESVREAVRAADLNLDPGPDLQPQRSGDLDRLPATRREAEAIAALVPEDRRRVALGFAASREAALSPEMADYRILHFATHGTLNTERPELSGLVLSRVDENGQDQDGFLRLHDIYSLRLGAELVVLSGCRTALGREVKGEGLVGLTRGFMYAGAPRVVSSLWKVPDHSTATLMTHFYTALLEHGKPAAQALREAQLELYRHRSSSDPYHWAAFILQGDWR